MRFVPPWLIAVLIAYTILAVIYSVSTPIFEPPDEVFHFPVIDHIADAGTLPVQHLDKETLWHQEGSQPPLYYTLSAPLITLIDRDDLAARQERNPHARIGIGLAKDNHVTVKHDWDAEAFPWSGTTLAVHVVRFFSILLSLGTVIAVYHIARLAAPQNPAIHVTAVLLAAFNPMFLFISASVNNDNLINLLSAITLALLLTIWRAGLTDRRVWTLAVIMALATLSKLSGLALYPTAALVVLLVLRRERRPFREWVKFAGIVLGVWIVLAGWWYARNIYLYGDPTGMARMIEIIGPREETPTTGDLIGEFEGFRLSFWGVFGTLNVIAPDILFDYGDALLLGTLLGGAFFLIQVWIAWRRGWFDTGELPAEFNTADTGAASSATDMPPANSPSPRVERGLGGEVFREAIPILILLLHTLIVFAALVNWTRQTPATQGRLLFPVLGALTTLMALGLAQLFPEGIRRYVTPVTAFPLVIAAWVLPFHTIQPTYALPDTVNAIPADAIPTDARFGPIELLGVQVDDHAPDPGDENDGLRVTLYWRPLDHTDTDMSLYVQVLGLPDPDAESGYQQIAKLDTYPGGGLLRTTTWDLDQIYADEYTLPIDADAHTPVQPILKIGWREFETGAEFEPLTLNGSPRDAVTVQAGRVVGDGAHLRTGVRTEAVFGGALRLNRATVTQSPDVLTVTLEWEARARVSEDFTVLVHLIPLANLAPDAASPGQPVSQGDSVPLGGRWPTSAWEPRVPFVDTYTIPLSDVPPASYRIAIGFYRPADFTRLPVETNLDTLPGAILMPDTITIE